MGLSFESDRNIQVTELNETSIMDGLVAYYTMDNLNLIDNSGNNNNGINYGATLATGISGNALSFNGTSNYIDCGNITSLNSLSEITVSCWVYSTNFAQDAMLVMKNMVNTVWEMYLEVPANVWKWRGGGTGNNMTYSLPSNNNWHHLLVTQSGINAIMYMNGNAVKANTADALGTSSNPVNIGRFADSGGSYYFNGLIDEVRIYNRALSAAEVKQLYKLHAPNNVASMKEE